MRFSFERRRYGSRTFTWAFVWHNDAWLSLGDPWPATTWPKKQLEKYGLLAISGGDLTEED